MRLVLPHRNKTFFCSRFYNHIVSNFDRIFHNLIHIVDHICRICTYQIQIFYRVYRVGNDHISLGNSEMRLVLPHRSKPFLCSRFCNQILSNFGRIFRILIRIVDQIYRICSCQICTYQTGIGEVQVSLDSLDSYLELYNQLRVLHQFYQTVIHYNYLTHISVQCFYHFFRKHEPH